LCCGAFDALLVMIDSLVKLLPAAQRQNHNSLSQRYALVTLHRPANVDDGVVVRRILQSLLEVSQDLAVVFPAHPRTRKRIADFGLHAEQLQILDPLSYLEFLGMQSRATVVIDSGGIQEETTYLGVPCLTLRENTERPLRFPWERTFSSDATRTNCAPSSPESSPARRRREPSLLLGTATRANESPHYSLARTRT
jgi:UDP-N-acetylglucosamine 2-epimerase